MIRLFHVSDLHFGAEDRDAIDWFAGIVSTEKPDAILVTGDITMSAKPAEFEAAARWLADLDCPVTLEVGNHDLPVGNLFERFLRPYRRYTAVEQMVERPLDFPELLVVPLRTTARFQWRFNWSKGHVSRHSLATTLAAIHSRSPQSMVFVLCHHPLIEAGTQMSSRTRGGDRALAALAAAGADVVLSGHVHDPFDVTHRTANGAIRLIGAGTLSERLRSSRPSFNSIAIAHGHVENLVQRMD